MTVAHKYLCRNPYPDNMETSLKIPYKPTLNVSSLMEARILKIPPDINTSSAELVSSGNIAFFQVRDELHNGTFNDLSFSLL